MLFSGRTSISRDLRLLKLKEGRAGLFLSTGGKTHLAPCVEKRVGRREFYPSYYQELLNVA